MALEENLITKLDDMKLKYDATEDASEKAKLEDIVVKYNTYKEIKLMMGKLRKMWRTEASERRQVRQLNSFISLYKGSLEIEESLKEKLGLTSQKEVTLEGLAEVEKWDAEIAQLENKLKEIEIKIPVGMSTREERFGPLR